MVLNSEKKDHQERSIKIFKYLAGRMKKKIILNFLKIALEYLKKDNKAVFNIFGNGPLLKTLKKI